MMFSSVSGGGGGYSDYSERDRLNTSVCGLVLCSPYFSGLRVKYSFKSAAATADAADAAAPQPVVICELGSVT